MSMNNQNTLLSRTGQAANMPVFEAADPLAMIPGHANGAAMIRRGDTEPDIPAAQVEQPQAVPEPPEEKDIFAQTDAMAAPAKPVQKPDAPVKQPVKQPAAKPATTAAKPIPIKSSPDALCQMYSKMFKDTLGLDLSMSICYENMRRICEVDVKDPGGTLYFLENTYRVSTLIYLAGNLPILFVASILAEKNRKNILKYVTIEVENGSKPYADLLELRRRRWSRKFEDMAVNDAMTVTPGATSLSAELGSELRSMLAGTAAKLRRFNNEMASITGKFDDGARNDVIYIYSNWWYLLQGFENVPEMRSYLMAITDDTRRNLKI